ncbi:zinc finger (Ran-binding) family protein [Rhynchospora pubera]|uniref:Zinc finger (Ran-binding) family protein n=1 Tax=Rhynchospora pubera TaxID=906938 RepID=A0AAV8HBE9_9POAL|nr:zinc finger (Ran-binding) family protein [Rhynchospora pubera]
MHRRLTSVFPIPTPTHSQFSLRLLFRFFSASTCTDPKLSFLYEQLEKTIAQPVSNSEDQSRETGAVKEEDEGTGKDRIKGREAVISHPWPEWVGLMELLLKKDYLDLVGLDDLNQVRTACLRFARDRPGIIRYLSRKEIHEVAGCGCPSLDRKVVNSGKRLRAHVRMDEGHVCSQCSLRGNCERAYVKARKEEYGRTVDVMRILLTYGLGATNGLVQNQACLNKPIKESVKKLMGDMVELGLKQLDSSDDKSLQSEKALSKHRGLNKNQMDKDQLPMKHGDWICPVCNFMNFAKNMKCLKCNSESEERYNILREEQEHLPLKAGDWVCQKCNFLNFAKNTECLQCHGKPTNRLLNAGEWECHSCYYVNFRRNEYCRKCGWKRPKLSNTEDSIIDCQLGNQEPVKKPIVSFVRDADDSNITHFSQRKSLERKEERKNNSMEIVDFPIVGGNSSISRDPRAREKWKEEMLRKSKGNFPKDTRDDQNFPCYSGIPKSFDLDESTDDEEMASWFVAERSNKNCS